MTSKKLLKTKYCPKKCRINAKKIKVKRFPFKNIWSRLKSHIYTKSDFHNLQF